VLRVLPRLQLVLTELLGSRLVLPRALPGLQESQLVLPGLPVHRTRQ
jgi:hypothetical protein